MSVFTLANQIPVQSTGRPYGLAKLYFYRAGTTTHQNVYTTAALSVAHDQPVVADADGVFAPIFLNPDASYDYRYQLKESDETLIKDIDNIPKSGFPSQTQFNALLALSDPYKRTAAEISEGETPVNYLVSPYNPLRYGTNTTPGTTDMRAAFQAAIDACPEGGEVVVDKVAGDYFIGSPGLTITKGIKITGRGYSNTGVHNYPTLIGDTGVNILTIGSADGVRAEVTGIGFKDGARGIVFTEYAHYCLFDRVRFDSQSVCAVCDDADPLGTYIGNVLSNFEITGCAKAFEFNRVYNQFKFAQGRVTGCTDIAVNFNNANPSHMSNMVFDFVVFESNQRNVFDVDGCVITCRNCHFEDNGSAGDGGSTIYADFLLRESTGSTLKTSLVLDRSFFSTAHADQSDERIHIEGPNVYVSLKEVGRPSSSAIVITNANATGVDLYIHDDPEAAGNWDIDALITDVIQITPAAGRVRIGGEGIRFKGSEYHRILRGTDTWDPGNLTAGSSTETSITVTGAALGDVVHASFSLNLGGIMLSAEVSATDTVRVVLLNRTAGAIDLGSGTVRIYVWKEA